MLSIISLHVVTALGQFTHRMDAVKGLGVIYFMKIMCCSDAVYKKCAWLVQISSVATKGGRLEFPLWQMWRIHTNATNLYFIYPT